jgi:alpha-glucosidase
VGSRVGSDIIDGMNILLTLLPGTSVTYYGEEIGMIDNTDITYEEGVDPWGCNYPPEEFSIRTRDFERTPFQWDSTVNAGEFLFFHRI